MARTAAPEVHTTAGMVSGAWKNNGATAVFRGIPFAAPPTQTRRWRAPQPVQAWSGVRSCTKDGPTAIQRAAMFDVFLEELVDGQGWSTPRAKAIKTLVTKAPKPKESEDCLHLTVRSPTLGADSALPVMVWIHGGDHQDGASTDPYYVANELASLGVVTVAVNYRLGLMGYFAHPELQADSNDGVATNFGTLDQIAALEWVRDNIAGFGGDPENVTIFGESAGGESVLHLMTSPRAQGLFHRAIAQSPANSAQMVHLSEPFLEYDSAEETSLAFTKALGITGTGQLERLRSRSVGELYALVRAAPRLGNHFPTIDGNVLPESPLSAFAAGRQSPVPFVIGTNANEGSVLYRAIGSAPMVEYRYQQLPHRAAQPEMAAAFGDDFSQLLEHYPGLDTRNPQAETDFLGDHMFGGRAFWYARHHGASGNPTWLYQFTRTPESPKQTAGAYHAAELSFVHGSNVPIFPMTAADKVLGAEMRRYWTELARVGNPNGVATIDWPQFDGADPQWLRLDHQVTAEKVDRVELYEVLNARTARLVDEMSLLAAGVGGKAS